MPYGYEKSGTKYRVYNKVTGKTRGHTTKQNLKKYLSALYVHEGLNEKSKKKY